MFVSPAVCVSEIDAGDARHQRARPLRVVGFLLAAGCRDYGLGSVARLSVGQRLSNIMRREYSDLSGDVLSASDKDVTD